MPRAITSFSNPTIKRVRSLADKKGRRAEGLFMAEGLRIVAEAVDAGTLPLLILFTEESAQHPVAARVIAATEAAGGEAIATSRDILHKTTGKDNPQAVVGVFPTRATPLEALDPAAAYAWIACEGLRDPGNLGTILRTADAAGAGGVILLDASCDPFSVEAVRASMGALFTQPIVQTTGPALFAWAQAQNTHIVGASLKATTDYQALDYRAPTLLLMGNEQSGLPADYEAQCHDLVRLPMAGKADSLNVAVATAVLLYEVFNQRRKTAAAIAPLAPGEAG